jgi:hypothetical protein
LKYALFLSVNRSLLRNINIILCDTCEHIRAERGQQQLEVRVLLIAEMFEQLIVQHGGVVKHESLIQAISFLSTHVSEFVV